MTDGKAKRRYHSKRREQQAKATRRDCVEAAARLFAEHGYVGTTMEAIAREANVAVQTVYAAFATKRAILRRLVDIAVVGDEEPVPLLERQGPKTVLRERDQHRQIAMFASDISQIMERVSPLFEVLRVAASTEPEIAALLDELLHKRLQGVRFFVDAVAARGRLRTGMTTDQAAQTVWALSSPDVHRLLTVKLGWSREDYQAWLQDMLQATLLA
jgi:AcrR family transcriptional regulator